MSLGDAGEGAKGRRARLELALAVVAVGLRREALLIDCIFALGAGEELEGALFTQVPRSLLAWHAPAPSALRSLARGEERLVRTLREGGAEAEPASGTPAALPCSSVPSTSRVSFGGAITSLRSLRALPFPVSFQPPPLPWLPALPLSRSFLNRQLCVQQCKE